MKPNLYKLRFTTKQIRARELIFVVNNVEKMWAYNLAWCLLDVIGIRTC